MAGLRHYPLNYHILWFAQAAKFILWLNPPPICDPKSQSFRCQCVHPADLVTQHVLSPRTRVEGSLGGLAVESWKKTLENSGRGLQNISEHHWIQTYIPHTVQVLFECSPEKSENKCLYQQCVIKNMLKFTCIAPWGTPHSNWWCCHGRTRAAPSGICIPSMGLALTQNEGSGIPDSMGAPQIIHSSPMDDHLSLETTRVTCGPPMTWETSTEKTPLGLLVSKLHFSGEGILTWTMTVLENSKCSIHGG